MEKKTLHKDDWLRFLASYSNEEKGQGVALIEATHLLPKVRERLQGFYSEGRKVNTGTSAAIGTTDEVCPANPSNLVKFLKN